MSIRLDDLVRDVAATVVHSDIQVDIEGSLGTIWGRPAEVETVIGNLLSNAVKHHPNQSPKIKIYRRNQGRHASIHIADDGPGIPLDRRDAIFAMYTTLDQLADPLSGVGLAMVKRTVEGWAERSRSTT